MAKKVYAIKEGFDFINNIKIENSIVYTWAECLKYVKGVKGAKYKSFESEEEARKFLNDSECMLKKNDNTYPKDCLHIYVDGSYNITTEEYSYGMVAVRDGIVEEILSGKGKSSKSRNIRQIAGELQGAIKGVEYAKISGENKVVIFHDYAGICYHATGFWERKEESSVEYYNTMQEYIKDGMKIIFVKVDSHTGDLFNELVDEKCKEELEINSDKVVEKWLANNNITVINSSIKEKIEKLISKNSENIIIKDMDNLEKGIEVEEWDLINKFKDNEISKEDLINYIQEGKEREFIYKLLDFIR